MSVKTIDSYISSEYLAVTNEGTVESIVQHLKNHRQDFQTKFTYVYVVDKYGRLKGVLQTRDLLLSEGYQDINFIVKSPIISIEDTSSHKDLISLFNRHQFLAVPVVDRDQKLKGVISRKSIQHLIPSRRDSDREEMEGSGVHEVVLKRLPWLVISVTSGLVCAYILGIFIGKIESIVAMILFVPIVLGLAGNIGTQTARITTKCLNEGKLSLTGVVKILGKQILVGFIISLVLFGIAAAIALLWRRSPVEGFILGVSILTISVVSSALGIIMPVTFKALKIGSNYGSGLFLLLVCDLASLIIYFAISLSFISPMLEMV